VVSNAGPSDATGATVSDTLPAALGTVELASVTTSGGATSSAPPPKFFRLIFSPSVVLPSGGSITYVLTGTLDSSLPAGSLADTATIAAPAGFTDTDPNSSKSNNSTSATVTDTVAPAAALTIIQRDNFGGSAGTVGSAIPGEAISYSVVVSNAGPAAATGVTFSDTLPAALTDLELVSVTPSGSATSSVPTPSKFYRLIFSPGVVLPSHTITYVFSGTIPSSATGQLSNTAIVTASNANPATVTATDVDNLTPQGGLSVTISDSAGGNSGGSGAASATGTAIPGTSISYTIVASNSGPSDAAGATLSDAFPAGFTVSSVTTSGSATSGPPPNNVLYYRLRQGVVLPVLPPGGSTTYVVTGTLDSSLPAGPLTDTATIAAPAGFTDTDSNAGNNSTSATVTDTLVPTANLQMTLGDNFGGSSGPTSSTGTAIPGEPFTYTMTVTNTGPSDAPDATVALPFVIQVDDEQLLSVVATGGASSSAEPGPISGSGGVDLSGGADLPAGSSIIYVLKGTLLSSATGPMSSTATVTPPPGVTNSGANTATDNDIMAPQGDLSVLVTDDGGGNSSIPGAVGYYPAGAAGSSTSINYTVEVSNSGPSDVTGAAITDTLPTGVTFHGAISGSGQVTNVGSGTPLVVNMPAGTSLTYVVTGTLDSSLPAGSLVNTATIAAPTGFADTDPNATSSTSSTGATVTSTSAAVTDVVRPAADVQITMSDSLGGNSATGAIGDVGGLSTTTADDGGYAIAYTITVTNYGPDPVYGATVADSAYQPQNRAIRLSSGTVSQTAGGATSNNYAIGTSFTIPAGGFSDVVNLPAPVEYTTGTGGTGWIYSSITYQISATVGTSATGTPPATLSNTATVTPPSGAAGSTGVAVVTDPNLANNTATDTDALPADVVASLSGQTTAVSGHDVIYDLQVTNYGPGTAQGVMVTYTVPAGITLDSAFDPTTLAPMAMTLISNNPNGSTTYGVQDSKNIADGAAKQQAVEGVYQPINNSNGGTGGTLAVSVSLSTSTAEAPVTTTTTGTSTTISPVLTASFSTQVNVAGASLVPDIFNAGETDLVVTGANCTVIKAGGGRINPNISLSVVADGSNLGTFSPTGAIFVYGTPTTSASQSDHATLDPSITLPAWLFGGDGPGANYLTGGGGNNVIVGGSGGPNYIEGGPGFNLIITGTDGGFVDRSAAAASPVGRRSHRPLTITRPVDIAASNNLVVVGSTSYDDNLAALDAIMNEWTSSDTIIQRIEEITSGVPANAAKGINSPNLLVSVALNAQTIIPLNAAAAESLYGSSSGDNLCLLGPGSTLHLGDGGTTGSILGDAGDYGIAAGTFNKQHNYIGKVTLIK
jgi:uncharacterized repeat protein (TIGR01451 family)